MLHIECREVEAVTTVHYVYDEFLSKFSVGHQASQGTSTASEPSVVGVLA